MPHQPLIGVLALQGAFAKHIEMLASLGVAAKEIRYPDELAYCDGLIIPGGESTVISRQIQLFQFEEPLREFGKTKAIFGTCAGLILMAKEVIGAPFKPFGMIDIIVERNAYGRQVESFATGIEINLAKEKCKNIPAIFIRAPRIKGCGKDVKVLALWNNEPVLVQQGQHLAATFHPELTNHTKIHKLFLCNIRNT